MYKTILVPVDISEDVLTDNALKHAIYLAKFQMRKFTYFTQFRMFQDFQ